MAEEASRMSSSVTSPSIRYRRSPSSSRMSSSVTSPSITYRRSPSSSRMSSSVTSPSIPYRRSPSSPSRSLKHHWPSEFTPFVRINIPFFTPSLSYFLPFLSLPALVLEQSLLLFLCACIHDTLWLWTIWRLYSVFWVFFVKLAIFFFLFSVVFGWVCEIWQGFLLFFGSFFPSRCRSLWRPWRAKR